VIDSAEARLYPGTKAFYGVAALEPKDTSAAAEAWKRRVRIPMVVGVAIGFALMLTSFVMLLSTKKTPPPIAEPMMAIGGLIIFSSLALGFPIKFLNRQEKTPIIYRVLLIFLSVIGIQLVYSIVSAPFRWMHLPFVVIGLLITSLGLLALPRRPR
jgi:hypothetical protein